MELKDGVELQKHKDEITKNRTRLLLQARVLEISEKIIQVEIDKLNHEKELVKAKESLAKLDK